MIEILWSPLLFPLDQPISSSKLSPITPVQTDCSEIPVSILSKPFLFVIWSVSTPTPHLYSLREEEALSWPTLFLQQLVPYAERGHATYGPPLWNTPIPPAAALSVSDFPIGPYILWGQGIFASPASWPTAVGQVLSKCWMNTPHTCLTLTLPSAPCIFHPLIWSLMMTNEHLVVGG